MPRTAERGLDYTYLDVNILANRKIRRLKRRAGKAAPYIYISLLCVIFKEGYYIQWDDDAILDTAEATGYDEEFVTEAVAACLEVGLFSKELYSAEGILTSRGIQQQYNFACQKLKRKSRVEEFSLLVGTEQMANSSEEIPNSSEDMQHNIGIGIGIGNNTIEEDMKDYSYSLSLSPSVENEEEQEQIVCFFTFGRNYVAPNAEYRRMVAYNNTPAVHKKWGELTIREKKAIIELWHPKDASVEVHTPRYASDFLRTWKAVYDKLVEKNASLAVRLAALSDKISYKLSGGIFCLSCPESLYNWIERPSGSDGMETNLRYIAPILQAYMVSHGARDLKYCLTDDQ